MGLVSLLVALAPLVSTALGISVNVHVSDHDGNLVFHPNYVWANPGDQVRFRFWPKNHTVTQSSFASPCVKLADGFDTGFVPVSQAQSDSHNRPSRTFNVTDTSPKWFYCQQKGHCGSATCQGMVFAINPKDGQFDTFKASAIQQNGTSATNSSSSATPQACAPADDSNSPLLNESGLVGGFFTCLYQSAGTCQYFVDGSFSSGASTCPDKIPGQQGLASNSTSTSTGSQCPSTDQQQSSLTSETDVSGGFVACTYPTARICTYFKADGSFSSGSSDCPAKITGSSLSTSNTSGALADSDTSSSTNLSTLVRNSWIILGLTAGILVLLVVFAVITIVGRKGLRGREAKYSKVSVPKGFQDEEESMTHKRYDESDI
ncbi:hypothetical protein QCA50_005137 [Cerrena zonata]|uniref:Uncharacterized protein n=1 Tax=Cerrena zonata TaxID=2478898 RepID=A0AAW0GPB1_9APHY